MSRNLNFAFAFAALLFTGFCSIPPAAAQQLAAGPIAPDALKWSPTPFPDVTAAVIAGNPTSGMYVVFAKYAAGGKSPPHTHPDQRIVTVISGVFYAGLGTEFDESKTMPLKPGTVVVVPAGTPHYGWAKDGEAIVEEVGAGPTGTKVLPHAAAK